MVRRSVGYSSLIAAAGLVLAATAIRSSELFADALVDGVQLQPLLTRGLVAAAVLAAATGAYLVVESVLAARLSNKRRTHDVRNVLRLGFGAVAAAGVAGVLTDQWLGVLFSLGVVGFAVTFALQQPLLSLVGWFYIVLKRPYSVGDRVEIANTRGDVIEVGFLTTTLWEVGGRLVTSGQPSGRVVTVPNAEVLSAQVVNDTTLFEFVWSEVSIQVAYETDLAFAREVMIETATDHLGEEMRRGIRAYRSELDRTAVELDVREGPTVNVVQQESWVELRLRFLSRSRQVTRNRNAIYERVLARFNEEPDRVKFPVSRNR
ncbi:mechanosensitive ion channel family protein [Halobellus captivus]|uniref:mechanosensitive ion channel family protein n=1 Tax=Halobellus captivus TaxID=2592614 RepID=UPI0011A1BFA9|nr:mechanosensitive ion channel domain-containing protein [Halobellus captivus]